MAGHILVDDSHLSTIFSNLRRLILPDPNHAKPSSVSQSKSSSATSFRNALITAPPVSLELRQNNPQDCSNLITASVNRATVEISRTIIALNATFSQQLQQASISASSGIKAAQDSASSTIAVVVQSASVATSSALSSLAIANLAVTSVSSASRSEISSLSSRLIELEGSLSSATASASSAIAAAQRDRAQSIGSTTVTLPTKVLLTPGQIAAIVVGAAVMSVLFSFAIFFLMIKLKEKKDRDSYLEEKNSAGSPRKLPSRLSSALRTGNAMTMGLNPPKASGAPAPSRSTFCRPKHFPVASSYQKKLSQSLDVEVPAGGFPLSSAATLPLTLSFLEQMDVPSLRSPSLALTNWPLGSSEAGKHYEPRTIFSQAHNTLKPTEKRESSSRRSTSAERGELSPFWRNSHIRNINSLLAQDEVTWKSEKLGDAARSIDRTERGRSMIRTSDIIDSRFLGRLLMSEKKIFREERETTLSPLRRNPVGPVITSSGHRNTTLLPLRRNPLNAERKRRTRIPTPPLTLKSLSLPIPNAAFHSTVSPAHLQTPKQIVSSQLMSESKTPPTSGTLRDGRRPLNSRQLFPNSKLSTLKIRTKQLQHRLRSLNVRLRGDS